MSAIGLGRLRRLDVQTAEVIGKLAIGGVICVSGGRAIAGAGGGWVATASKRKMNETTI